MGHMSYLFGKSFEKDVNDENVVFSFVAFKWSRIR
jgi:hypothetical protein